MDEFLTRLYEILETVGYYLLLLVFIGKVLFSILKRFVVAIDPAAKKTDNPEKLETPTRVMLALANGVAWTLALLIPTAFLGIDWFEDFYAMVLKLILLVGGMLLAGAVFAYFDKGVRKTVVSILGYWYIRYHQDVKKGKDIILHFRDGALFTVSEVYLLHSIGVMGGSSTEICLSNADILTDAFGVGAPENEKTVPEKNPVEKDSEDMMWQE